MATLRAAGAALLRPRAGPTPAALGYHKKVVDHYENPRNVGSLDRNAKNVGTGLVGAPACGDVMKLQVEVDENGRIVDARFKTFGCGSAIASSSLATEWVKGKTVRELWESFRASHPPVLSVQIALARESRHCFVLELRRQ
ncbi:iron-sulfur cluster assembly enzyme ISCU, mitochondrial [Empidonax traillii]|uniref:iron-sulfur cluster assembly enzyme ISCU, mitochondrial n=1 Tax=Empidonax traillii TaxID=164674 RepID=UPI000FFD4E31|nr:iron-sulfur cluster assembly enzyme ISCU, mitochondrial [Empidonax traillii]